MNKLKGRARFITKTQSIRTKQHAFDLCPWARTIVDNGDGFFCFELNEDAQNWLQATIKH